MGCTYNRLYSSSGLHWKLENAACSIIGTPEQVDANTEILFTCFMARHCYPLVSVLIHPYYEKLMAP